MYQLHSSVLQGSVKRHLLERSVQYYGKHHRLGLGSYYSFVEFKMRLDFLMYNYCMYLCDAFRTVELH